MMLFEWAEVCPGNHGEHTDLELPSTSKHLSPCWSLLTYDLYDGIGTVTLELNPGSGASLAQLSRWVCGITFPIRFWSWNVILFFLLLRRHSWNISVFPWVQRILQQTFCKFLRIDLELKLFCGARPAILEINNFLFFTSQSVDKFALRKSRRSCLDFLFS